MAVIRVTLLLATLVFCLASCTDSRHELVRSYLRAHPPEGFEVVAIREDFVIAQTANHEEETVVFVRYRLIQPTVKILDAFSLPRGRDIVRRIAAVRGWALAALPTGNQIRESIVATSASARFPIPIKRIVTQRGTEFEVLVPVHLRKEAIGWRASIDSLTVGASGSPDQHPELPFEDSDEATIKLNRAEATARHLELLRETYLSDLQRKAEQSLAILQSRLQTGNTFEGHFSDHTPFRLIISRGANENGPITAVLTILQSREQSVARYTGGMIQEHSGKYVWRATHVTALSGTHPATVESFHPILILGPREKGLDSQLTIDSLPPTFMELQQGESIDLIPEPVQKQ